MATENIELNVAKMKPGEVINVVTALVSASKSGTDLNTINLIGPPGIAKSDSVRAIAANISRIKGKQVKVHDIRLSMMSPVDLRGVPSKATIVQRMKQPVYKDGILDYTEEDVEINVARWLRPEIFQMSDSDDIINFLFLDEITAAPPSVQAAAYQLVLDRKIGEHQLPDNVYVICAGNRTVDKAVSFKMSTALANRMIHIEVYPDIDDWKNWAINKGIDPRIISFLNWKPDMLFKFDPNSNDLAFCSPRSWEIAHNILQKIPDIDVASPLIAGAVGLGAAQEFVGHTKVFHALPNVADIFNGKQVEYPKAMDVSYALSASLVTYAQKATKKQVNNMITWMIKWQPDYAILTAKDCLRTPKLLEYFSSSKAWIDWYVVNKDFIDLQ